MEQANKLIASLASMDIKTMYAWLNVLEAVGIVKTPIPTVTDADEIGAAIGSWADNQVAQAQGREDDPKRDAWGGGLGDDFNYAIFRFLGGTKEEWEQHTPGDPLWTGGTAWRFWE